MGKNELHDILSKEIGSEYTYGLRREEWGYVVTITRSDRAGTVSLHWYDDESDKVYLTSLNVLKEQRMRGYGSSLQTVCEDLSKKLGFKEMLLSVNIIAGVDNPLIGMYKQRGYKEISAENRTLYMNGDIYYKLWLSKLL